MASQRKFTTFTTSTAATVFCWSLAGSSTAMAQTPAPTVEQPPAEAPAAAAPPAPAPAVEPAPPPVPVPAVAAPVVPPPSLIPDGEAPKGPIAPAFPPAIPSIDYGARMRGGLKVQGTSSPDKLNDVGEQWDTDIILTGQIHRYFKWTASVTLSYTGAPGASNAINVIPLDVYAHFAPLPEFNIMMGRMLVVADRFTPGGPWGQEFFLYPGFFPLVGAPALPKSGPTGRDLGATVWGALFEGHAKYYVGVFNLNDPASRPLYTGRLQVSLLGAEPNFNQRATYYGTKDLIAVGVGGQYQKDGSASTATPPALDDYKLFTGDLTFEKSFPGVGTVSAIGAYSKYWGQYQPWKQSYLGEVGYMLPKPVLIGKPRLSVRYQGGKSPADGAKTTYAIDTQLSYNIHAWFARLMLGYRRGDTWLAGATQASNMLYFGVQLWDP